MLVLTGTVLGVKEGKKDRDYLRILNEDEIAEVSVKKGSTFIKGAEVDLPVQLRHYKGENGIERYWLQAID